MDKRFLFPALGISIIGVMLLLYATRSGMGITPDSVEYLFSSRTFLNGEGLRSIHGSMFNPAWQTHFPPGIPVFFGSIGYLLHSNDIEQIARFCNALFFGGTIFICGILLFKSSGNMQLSLIAQVLLVMSIDTLQIHMMLWSEPMFLFVMMLALWVLLLYIESNKIGHLLVAAIVIAIASVTRYVGVTLVLTGAILVLYRGAASLRKKIQRAVLFGAVSCSLITGWMIRNHFLTHESVDRKFSFHPMGREYLDEFLDSIRNFFFQLVMGSTESLVIGVVIILIAIFLFFYFRSETRSLIGGKSIGSVFAVFVPVYLVFLLASNTFFDFSPLYFRITFPALIGIFMFTFDLIDVINKRGNIKWKRGLRSSLRGTFLLYFALQFCACYRFISKPQPLGDYSGRSWRTSETLEAMKRLPSTAVIYSGEPDAVYYVTDRIVSSVRVLPEDYLHSRDKDQYLVVFKSGRSYDGATYDKPLGVGALRDSIILIHEFSDGKIYKLK